MGDLVVYGVSSRFLTCGKMSLSETTGVTVEAKIGEEDLDTVGISTCLALVRGDVDILLAWEVWLEDVRGEDLETLSPLSLTIPDRVFTLE